MNLNSVPFIQEIESLFTHRSSNIANGETSPTSESSKETIMATTQSATLTITSQELANPIVVQIEKSALNIPVTADATFTMQSPAGTIVTEQITMSLTVEGFPIVTDKVVADFPVDASGELGTVISSLVKAIDATIVLDIKAA